MPKAKKLNLKTVLDEIFLEGGVSYNVTTGEVNPKTGYMVGILGFEKQYDLDTIKANDLRDFVSNNAYDLWGENRFVGGWIDTDTQKVVLDISVNITDVTNACYTGIINKQKCIYDCSNKRNISLPAPQLQIVVNLYKIFYLILFFIILINLVNCRN
jgi:hypothetical protein